MEIHQGWDQHGKKATVIRVSRHEANYWSAWDPSMANPQTLFDAERAFGSMLTTARKVVRGFETGTPIEADCVTAPIRNMYAWHSTCKQFVESRLVALRLARSRIPSPADYQGTQTRSFCEQAVNAVDQLIRQLWHFVESPNQDPAEQVQAASTRGEKMTVKPIHADDLLTLVLQELKLSFHRPNTYSMSDISEKLSGIDGRTLKPHFEALEIEPAKRGGKDWSISHHQLVALLRRLANSKCKHAVDAQRALISEGCDT